MPTKGARVPIEDSSVTFARWIAIGYFDGQDTTEKRTEHQPGSNEYEEAEA